MKRLLPGRAATTTAPASAPDVPSGSGGLVARALVFAVLAMGCGGVSVASFQEQARAAKACDPLADRCVNAGAGPCLCATPVNSKKAAEIDELAVQVSCGGATVRCAPQLNPRCVDSLCVADSR